MPDQSYAQTLRLREQIQRLAEQIAATADRPGGRGRPPWQFMEVCGTHSHAVGRYGIKQLLPENVTLLSGPGCPVCVTPTGEIDAAIELAARPETIVTTFGDMLRPSRAWRTFPSCAATS